MRPSFAFCALSAALLLGGCQAVNTTSGDSVGVERKQYMFSMLSTDEVNKMYAQSYQQTVGEATSKGCWTPPAPMPSGFMQSPID